MTDVDDPRAALAGLAPSGAMAVLDVLASTRAVRTLRPDPVDPVLVDTLLWAATRAASPNNTQLWHFVVVTDPVRRQEVATALGPFARWIEQLPEPVDDTDARIREGARRLLVTIAECPVLVVVCAEHRYPEGAPEQRYLWSVVGGACQNLLVAARALGLGATLTMFHVLDERGLAAVLGLPDGVRIGAIVPIGWPTGRPGPVRRRPMSEVVHRGRW